jgi:hypothetical protein
MKKLCVLFILLFFTNQSFSVSRFDSILKEINKYQDFETESEIQICNFIEENPKISNEYLKFFTQQHIVKRDIFVESLYEKALKLQKGKLTGSEFLHYLLEHRLKSLYGSTCHLEENDWNFINIPPDDTCLFNKWLSKYSTEKVYSQFNELVKNANLKSYQLIVLLIKKTFQFLSLTELSHDTLKLLRASPALWNILQNKTFDLGFLDQSGRYIKIKIYMEHFKCTFEEALFKIRNNILCRKWENKKRLYDLYLYESHFIPKTKFIESKMLGANGSGMNYTLTDYESGECDDLPYPEFLKNQSEHAFLELPNFFDTFNFDLFSDETNIFEEKTLTSTKNINNDVTNTEQTDFSNVPLDDIIDHSEPVHDDESMPDETKIKIENNFVYPQPSGIRKFHNLMPESDYPILALKKKSQHFIDKIFNSKTSHTINYGEFKNFWIKMGGKIIENTGSSHKQLIGPNGDALYGVSAHNEAQTYGKKTIKYFRAALYYIGCRPS